MRDVRNRHHLNRQHLVRRLALLAVIAVALALATMPVTSAMGSRLSQSAQTRPHLVTVVQHDFSFTMPATIPTGLTEFIVVNRGTQAHMAQFFKLKSGVTDAQFLKALKSPKIATLLAVASAAGGTNSMKPGGQQHVLVNLSAGRYEAVCFDATPKGTPHFLLGMHKLFTVAANTKAAVDTNDKLAANGTPVASGTVILRNFSITIPSAMLKSGLRTFKVTNEGTQTHEFALLRMNAGKGKNDVLAALRSNKEPPGTEVGGSGALAPGTSDWIETDLGAGTYVAFCEVPDIKTGMPHVLMGMITQFTVK